MARPAVNSNVINANVLKRTTERFREAGVVLPTIAQLKDPTTIPSSVRDKLRAICTVVVLQFVALINQMRW